MNSHKHPSRGILKWINKPDDHYMAQALEGYLRKKMMAGGCRILFVSLYHEGVRGLTGPVYYG
jgi:hypothetical protein